MSPILPARQKLILKLKEKTKNLNFKILTKDIEPFLFDPNKKNRVLYFKEWLNSL